MSPTTRLKQRLSRTRGRNMDESILVSITPFSCMKNFYVLVAKMSSIPVFANAGILDTFDFYAQETLPPPEPNLLCSKVSCDGAIYTSYLALHYFRQNPVKECSLIMTSSGWSSPDPTTRSISLLTRTQRPPCMKRPFSRSTAQRSTQ